MRLYLGWVLGLCAVVGLCLLSGCAIVSHGQMKGIDQERVNVIQVGTSTERDIIDKFGTPEQVISKPNDVKVYIYSHGIENSIMVPFIFSVGRAGGSGQRLSVYFKNGVVSDYEYMTDNRKTV